MEIKKATEIKPNDWIYIYDSKLQKYRETLVSKVLDLDTITNKPIGHKNCVLYVSASCRQYIFKKDENINFIKSQTD